ncbi:translation initiation factor IF-2-like [Parus major]|uniref:translation initiation factor IF-2-like n=1 Tax=Parus major TaxID=9157 RepID=UPI00077161A2|nr:translation initiation factor IF-2-like [Parus major]
MARRKPGRGGGERGKRGVARAALPRQRRVPAKCARPVAVTARSPGRVSAPPFNPRAAAAAGGGGNNNSQPPAANAAAVAASQRDRARSLRPEKESPPPPRPLLSPHGPARRPFPPRPPPVPGAAWRGQPGGEEGGSRALLPPGCRPAAAAAPGAVRRWRGERGERYAFISGKAGGLWQKMSAGWAGRRRAGGERRFLCAVPERGGIRRTGRRRGCGGAAATRGGGGGAGSSRVLASQEWEASEAKMPPGSAAPLGKAGASTLLARRGSPLAQPAPSEPARDLGARPGALASAHQTYRTDESPAFQERWAERRSVVNARTSDGW